MTPAHTRSLRLPLAGLAVAVLLASAAPAAAQDAAALKRELAALKARIAELERRIEREEHAAGAPAPAAGSRLVVEAEGAPRFSGEGFENFKLRGRIQADIGQVGDPDEIGTVGEGGFVPDSGLGTTSEMRRARIGVEGEISDWKYKLEADFAPGESDIADALIEYRGFERVAIAIGQQKTPGSMEEVVSSRFSKFMERGGFTDAFGLSRELGVSVALGGESWGWRSGAFLDGGLSGDDSDSGYLIGSRLHYAMMDGKDFLHLGTSVEFRDNGAQPARFRQRPFLHSTDTRLIDTGELATRNTVFLGGELAGVYGPFNFSGEYGAMLADLRAVGSAGGGTAHLQGGFLHLGYFLTGERRGYDPGKGLWGRTRPARPLGEGGIGAFEINAGLDWVDLDDAGDGVLGGSQTAFAVGLTWVPVGHVRVLANFSHIEVDDSPTRVERGANGGFDRDISLNSFGLRTEVDW